MHPEEPGRNADETELFVNPHGTSEPPIPVDTGIASKVAPIQV
jgi:hypothetical protein